MTVTSRYVSRDPADWSREVVVTAAVELDPSRTAVVICDMWDRHWCAAATRRVAEMAPRVDRLASTLRQAGVVIVHAPSETLDAYADHPARLRAGAAAAAHPSPPVGWAVHDPVREGPLPVDDSDGGCPCDPPCAQAQPWSAQIASIAIHDEDVICDSSDVYSVYAARGIDTVVMMGVHTNMCVLGRPFGIRASVRRGLRVLLVRDLTDTMYNPARRPWVDHFTGTELVVRHIETYWCPTFTSDEVVGGEPFRFAEREG